MNTASSSGSGTLLSNTITNNRSTKDVQPLVVQIKTPIPNSEPVVAPAVPVSAPKPNQNPLIPYPSRLHDQNLYDKGNDQKEFFFSKSSKILDFNFSFIDALILMPKFGPTIKSLLTNKDKLFELARTSMNEHYSAVLLKKLPEKLGDPSKFLIPCDFLGMDECLALVDLGASINLMRLDSSCWQRSHNDIMANRIDVIDMACEEYTQEVLGFFDMVSTGNPTPYYDPIISTSSLTITPFEDSDFLLEEVDAFLALEDDPTLPEVDHSYFDTKGDILLLEAFLNGDPSLSPPNQEMYLPQGEDKLPVIIAKDVSVEEKEAHIKVLKSHKQAIAWKLSDIKGASINLMPLSVYKKLGLPELISTRMTLELANRAIYTPAGIARDVFVLVGKFTFPADFVIVDYESNPRVPLILGRPFLRTARALIDVHGEEMILHDGYERLTLNMRHDTSSYSNQPHKESINMINIYNDSYEDYLKEFFSTNHLIGNPTFSSHTDLTSPKGINPLSDNTTSSSPDHLLEEEIEYLLNHDPSKEIDSILEDSVDKCNLADPNNDLVDTILAMFTDEHTLDYSSPPLYNDVDDDLVELESDNDDVYDDLFDSKEDNIKESKLLINELDPPRSSDFLPSPEYRIFARLKNTKKRTKSDQNRTKTGSVAKLGKVRSSYSG
nr:reverse transcriptase domain-containing protein [Tanacetum cinerariifolium]